MIAIASAKTVPSAFNGRKDISDTTFGDTTSALKVLVVSKDSDYKERIAHAVADSLVSDSLSVIVGGVRKLKKINPSDFKAIVIINTCLSWQIDNKVQTFFRKNPNYKEVVLLTTSADPDGCGKGRHVPKYVDAITSASKQESFLPAVIEIVQKTRAFLK